MNPSELKKLSTVERLQAMEVIWDTLLHEEVEISSPEWHEKVLEERRSKIESGEAEFIPLSELKKKRR